MILNRWLEIIDQRIRAHASPVTKMGTVQSRADSGPLAMVTIDGSTLAVPVKVSADVRILADDRVCLVLFGSEWTVVASFGTAAAGPNVETGEYDGTLSQTVTGTANTDIAGAVFPVLKELTGTRMRVTVHGSLFRVNPNYTRLHYGVKLTYADTGVATSYDVGRYGLFDTIRTPMSAFRTLSAAPAGRYTVQLYMRLSTATGQVTIGGAEDYWMVKWEEVP